MSERVLLAVLLTEELVVGDEVVCRLNNREIAHVESVVDAYNKTGYFDAHRARVPGTTPQSRQPPWGSGHHECSDGEWWKSAIVLRSEARDRQRDQNRDDRIVEGFEKYQRGEATAVYVGTVNIPIPTAREAWDRVLKRRMAKKESEKVLAPIDDPDFA